MKNNRFVSAFTGSFKDLNYRSAIIIVIDILAFFLTAFALKRGIGYVQSIIVSLPHPDELFSLSLEEIQAAFTPNPQVMIIVSLILMAAVVLIIFALSRSAVWLLSEKKQMNPKSFARFTLILLYWYVAVLIPAGALFYIMKPGIKLIFLAVIAMLFLHYSQSLNIALTKSQRFRQIITAFKTGTKKIHLFLLSYLLSILAFIILSQAWWIYRHFMDSYLVPRIITLAIVMCWTRYFMIKIIP
ncbi:MAG: hypothetical protein U9R34_06525 [Nanoarchaeota archaeon]|nr:hypothetical protein [Nanoarchaeota archaeon]